MQTGHARRSGVRCHGADLHDIPSPSHVGDDGVRARPGIRGNGAGANAGDEALGRPWTKYRPADDVTPHTLRHSFATIATEGGFPEAVVAALLGHKLASVTAAYTHVGAAHLLEAADKVSERISALMGDNVVQLASVAA